jgi:hypothetical protein
MKKIMLLARDPGGANVVGALVEALRAKGYKLAVYGKDQACRRFEQMKIDNIDLNQVLKMSDAEEWLPFLQREKPDFILTGTSGDDFSERWLWQAAHIGRVKCAAILDQWMNFGIRFSVFTTAEQEEYAASHVHPYIPDYILVMDEEIRRCLIDDGIPPQRIYVTGQPYFDYLLAIKEKYNRTEKMNRPVRGATERELRVTYVSEPLSYDYRGDSTESKPYWGYDEITIARQLFAALQDIGRMHQRRIVVITKLHPREPGGKYPELIQQFADSCLHIEVVKETEPWEFIQASHLVCGMSSMLLLESVLLGKATLSIQIGLERPSPFVLDQRGILPSIRDYNELYRQLRDILIYRKVQEINWRPEAGAIKKIIKIVEEEHE